MRLFIRSLAALGIGLAVPASLIAFSNTVQAQAADADQGTKQIALTGAQIEAFIAAQKPVQAAMSKLSQADQENPSPAAVAKLDAVAKANKFASFAEYQAVADNIGLVMAGIDPQTKKYVGAEVLLKQQIAQVTADKSLSAKDKKDQLDQLNEALKSVEPVTVKGNIDLVVKYYDQLLAAMPQEQ
jgi:hypothetical protein